MHRKLIAVATLFYALAAPAFAADSPMFRGNPAHTGVFPGAGPAAMPVLKWKFRTGGSVSSSPAVAGGTVYVASNDGCLYAIAASDGRQRWKFATGARVTSSPAVAGGLVYVAGYDGNVYAVDAATGKKRWQFATLGERRFTAPHLHGALPVHELMPDPWDFFSSSPSVSQGIVYVGSGDRNVYALDAASGRLRWKFRTGNVVHASPAVADGTVYVGSWDSYFYALDAASGAVKWKFKTGEDHDIFNHVGIQSSAAVVEGVVYFGSRDAHVYAVDARTGRRKWAFATADGAWASSSPAVAGGRVYFGEGSSGIYRALDAKTGKAVLTLDNVAAGFSSPAIAGRTLYVGLFAGGITALDLSAGKIAWTFSTGAPAASAPPQATPDPNDVDRAFYDNMVERVNGRVARGVLSSPAIVDGVIYVGSGDGYLYALR